MGEGRIRSRKIDPDGVRIQAIDRLNFSDDILSHRLRVVSHPEKVPLGDIGIPIAAIVELHPLTQVKDPGCVAVAFPALCQGSRQLEGARLRVNEPVMQQTVVYLSPYLGVWSCIQVGIKYLGWLLAGNQCGATALNHRCGFVGRLRCCLWGRYGAGGRYQAGGRRG